MTRANSRGFVSSLDLRELSAVQEGAIGPGIGFRPQLSKALSESVGVSFCVRGCMSSLVDWQRSHSLLRPLPHTLTH